MLIFRLSLLSLALSQGICAHAQVNDLYPGQVVEVIAPGRLIDHQVGRVTQFNGVTASVDYMQVDYDEKKQPVLTTKTGVFSKSLLQPVIDSSLLLQAGQLVQIKAQGFPEDRVIAAVEASDGNNVIVTYNIDPSTRVRRVWNRARLKPVNRLAFLVAPGDVIRIEDLGFRYSGLNATVSFTNGAQIWFDYMDNAGVMSSGVTTTRRYTILKQAIRIDFDFNTLDASFLAMADVSYGSRNAFFALIAERLSKDFSLNSDPLTQGNALAARAFLTVAAAPVIQGSDSEIFVYQVRPSYLEARKGIAAQSLLGFELSEQVFKAACVALRASLQGMTDAVANTDKDALMNLNRSLGLMTASSLSPATASAFLKQVDATQALLARLSLNYETKDMAITFLQVVEYLKAKRLQ